MYTVVLWLHSWVRWVVLVVGVILVVRAWWRWLGRKDWEKIDETLRRVFSGVVDLQLLLGLLLFLGLSPATTALLEKGGQALADPGVRFWTMEHVVPMIVAVILVHVGQMLITRTSDAEARYRWAAIVFGVVMLLILASIPWPISQYSRPLFRLA